MSLKTFHIAFIAISSLLAFGFAIWAVRLFATGGDGGMLVAAAASALCGMGLIAYGVRFLKKLKNVRFL